MADFTEEEGLTDSATLLTDDKKALAGCLKSSSPRESQGSEAQEVSSAEEKELKTSESITSGEKSEVAFSDDVEMSASDEDDSSDEPYTDSEEMNKQPSWIEDTNEIFDRIWGWKAEAENARDRAVLKRQKTNMVLGLRNTAKMVFGASSKSSVKQGSFGPRSRATITPTAGTQALSEQVLQETWRTKPLWSKKDRPGYLPINPDGTFRMFWNLGSVFMIIWTVIFAPIYLCIFDLTTTNKILFGVEWFITGWFSIDIFVNFASAYWEEVSEGASEWKLQKNFQKIAKRYMKGWLFLDVVATFPFELFMSEKEASVLGVLKVMRLLRLLRIAKLKAIVTRIFMAAAFDFRAKVAKELVNMVIVVAVLAHWNSCAWVALVDWARIREYDPIRFDLTEYENDPEQLALQRWCVGMTWAIIVLTIGSTDPVPQKNSERLVLAVACLFNIVIVASIVGSLTRIVLSNSEADGEVMTQLKTVGKAMKQADIPHHVIVKIRNFLAFQMGNGSTHKCLSTLEQSLPPNLFRELRYYMIGKKYLNLFGPLKACGTYFMLSLMTAIEHHMCSPQDIIAQEGEEMLEMIFLLKGTLGSYSFAQAENPSSPILTERLRILPNRTAFCWFNELVLFQDANETCIHEETVTALSLSELLVLPRQECENVVQKHTEWKERWASLCEQVNDPDADLARLLGCGRCQSNRHYGDDCPLIGGQGDDDERRSKSTSSSSSRISKSGGTSAFKKGKQGVKALQSVMGDILTKTTNMIQHKVPGNLLCSRDAMSASMSDSGNRNSGQANGLHRSGTGYITRLSKSDQSSAGAKDRSSQGADFDTVAGQGKGNADNDQDACVSPKPVMKRGVTTESIASRKSVPKSLGRSNTNMSVAKSPTLAKSATKDFGKPSILAKAPTREFGVQPSLMKNTTQEFSGLSRTATQDTVGAGSPRPMSESSRYHVTNGNNHSFPNSLLNSGAASPDEGEADEVLPKPALKKSATASQLGAENQKEADFKKRNTLQVLNGGGVLRPQSADPNLRDQRSNLLGSTEVEQPRPYSALAIIEHSDDEEKEDYTDETDEEREGRVKIGTGSVALFDQSHSLDFPAGKGFAKSVGSPGARKASIAVPALRKSVAEKNVKPVARNTLLNQQVSGKTLTQTKAWGNTVTSAIQSPGPATAVDQMDDAAIVKHVLGVVQFLQIGAMQRQNQIKQLNERLDRFKSTVAEVTVQQGS
eukprot:gnl/MRDRNA2_/MRDRNA2_72895_c0_seq1.p1 gnl/MRDRNA2_/MRDRNA2_72895_c0~~gnl/MRDRNA2_/MRDRNA2_72895_c0_seq1.p1  ORF type:complete len:1216 (+),score=237.52 gnl/MRDRNA2_/MRDRNA2_72895_c0_seq1:69-3716(+)